MGNKAASSMSPEKLDSGKPRVKSIGSGVLPVAISRIVAEYLSDDSSDYVKAALVGVQPINLCLSQVCDLPLSNVLVSLGFVSPKHRWVPAEFRIDKKFSIKDQKSCLDFLERNNSNYCSVAIEVLTVDLYMGEIFRAHALDDLQNTIVALQKHLKSVKQFFISINDCTCCIFSLNEVIDSVTGAPQTVDQSEALFCIIDDLKTCWKKNSFTGDSVYAFYFKSRAPRVSEKYLSRFAIDFAAPFADKLLKEEALRIPSGKIMWVLNVNKYPFNRSLLDYTRMCHASYWNAFDDPAYTKRICGSLKDAFCYRDNPFVERIAMNCICYGQTIQLPRPRKPLTDATPRSALIELTLKGDENVIHLTLLNDGYFPHLRHLCITGGTITGHLDSHRVPLLETLILEPGRWFYEDGSPSHEVQSLIRERVQPLLRCGRPWQLVTAQTNGGWSFASYDEPIANSQDEVKDNSTFSGSSLHALPRIRELLLVVSSQNHAKEWQEQLKGSPSLEAAAKDHKDRLLLWEPQCVEQISVVGCVTLRAPLLEFTWAKLEQERILTSLKCYCVSVDLDGAALPHLQSLELVGGMVKLSGAFLHLQTLYFQDIDLLSKWEMGAPLLQSLNCYRLINGQKLSMSPKGLPQLSFLRILLWEVDHKSCPVILDDESGLIFPHLTRVEFGKGMTRTPFFDQCQATSISNLELTVNVMQLPACWESSEWLCETLEIVIYAPRLMNSKSEESLIEVRLPFLPRVKTLTVIESLCTLVLSDHMPNLTALSLTSPALLGRNLSCPALKRICFTNALLDVEKKRALDPAIYVAIGAQPREIIFAADYELHTMAW